MNSEPSSNNSSDNELTGPSASTSANGSTSTEKNANAKAGGGSLWNQWMTSTGWFAPLLPVEPQESVAEKQKLAKEASVHSWRPSNDDHNNNVTVKRPTTFMRRLSSAIEMKWWSANAPAPEETAPEEEDLQRSGRSASNRPARSSSVVSTSSPLNPINERNQDMQLR